MKWLTALFVAYAASGGMFHSTDEPPAADQPHYTCEKGSTDIFTDPAKTLQLGSFECALAPTPTLLPTSTPSITPRIVASPTPTARTTVTPYPTLTGAPIPTTTPIIGGPEPPLGYYCIDDEDPDGCDDDSSHIVPKGTGGTGGSCGTIIEQSHKIVESLPQEIKYNQQGDSGSPRDRLNFTVSNCGYSTGPQASGYVSTYFVIDSFRLAGFAELSKTDQNHVSPSGLYNWWQNPPAGYVFVPNTPQVMQEYAAGSRSLTGCAIFFQTSSSFHVGIVNTLEMYSASGDGVLSMLQAGTLFYLDRFPMHNWNVENASTNMTNTSGLVGFGCHI